MPRKGHAGRRARRPKSKSARSDNGHAPVGVRGEGAVSERVEQGTRGRRVRKRRNRRLEGQAGPASHRAKRIHGQGDRADDFNAQGVDSGAGGVARAGGHEGAREEEVEAYVWVWRDGKLRKEIAPTPEPETVGNGVTVGVSAPVDSVAQCAHCRWTDEPHFHGHILYQFGRELF